MENNSLSRESKLEDKEYKWGFTTDVDTEVVPKGLSSSHEAVSDSSSYRISYEPIACYTSFCGEGSIDENVYSQHFPHVCWYE